MVDMLVALDSNAGTFHAFTTLARDWEETLSDLLTAVGALWLGALASCSVWQAQQSGCRE